MLPRVPLILFSAIVTIATAPAFALAQTPISVTLASGRTMTGVVDARSSETQLWLRRGDEEASIARPIDWQNITSAQRDGEALSLDQLQALAKNAAAAPIAVAPADFPQPKWRGVFAIAAPNAVVAETLPPVRSLAIDAFAANWDSDVETDGLVITVYPLDAYGQIVPVNGSLEVELIAPEVRRFHDAAHGRGLTLERVGQWTSAIHLDDVGPSGARVELPFQAVHPEFDTKILPQGLVHARLVVPGQGTFDATAEFIRIRPWSPLRDKYWRDTGRRFFPNEQTGRPKRVD